MKTFSENSFVRKRIWQTDKLHCNMYCFEPGQQNSLHRHPVSDGSDAATYFDDLKLRIAR